MALLSIEIKWIISIQINVISRIEDLSHGLPSVSRKPVTYPEFLSLFRSLGELDVRRVGCYGLGVVRVAL